MNLELSGREGRCKYKAFLCEVVRSCGLCSQASMASLSSQHCSGQARTSFFKKILLLTVLKERRLYLLDTRGAIGRVVTSFNIGSG